MFSLISVVLLDLLCYIIISGAIPSDIQEVAVMDNMLEIMENIQIGLVVAIFLLNTGRGLPATELCNECLILLNNITLGIEDQFTKSFFSDIYELIFNAYYLIYGYPHAEIYARNLLEMFQNAGTLTIKLGEKYERQSRYVLAKEIYESAVDILKTISHKDGEAVAYGRLGVVFHSLGEYERAKQCHEKALAITVEIGDRAEEGTSYGNLGAVFRSLGEYQKAKEHLEKALAITVEIGDREGEGRSYGNLGAVFATLGEYQKAKEYYEKALAITVEIGDREGEGRSYGNLGAVFATLGEYQKAKEYFEKALAITVEIGDREGERTSYGLLGTVFCSLGKYQKAKEYLEKALAIAMEIGDRKGQGTSYGNLGAVFFSLGNYQKAKEYQEKALAITMEIGDRYLEAKAYTILGQVFESLGEYDVADEYLEKAHLISSDIGHNMAGFKILVSFTQLKLSQSKFQEAISYLFQCIEKYEKLQNFLKGNDEFKISLLERHGTFPYKLFSKLLCATGKPRDTLYVEELGRARGLAEFMADKFSVENHISASPKSWFGIENIVKRESNCACLYISYRGRDVLLWVLKTNEDIHFRKSTVNEDTLRSELVVDVEGIF